MGRLDFENQSDNDQIEFQVCPGTLSSVQGVGLTISFVRCLQQAYLSGADEVIFYEDDALLLDKKFCQHNYQQSLLESRPKDTLILLLGAHDFILEMPLITNSQTFYEQQENANFVRLRRSFGTYGFAVSRAYMKQLARNYLENVSFC